MDTVSLRNRFLGILRAYSIPPEDRGKIADSMVSAVKIEIRTERDKLMEKEENKKFNSTLKPFTMYRCPDGPAYGHSSQWTGVYLRPKPGDGLCVCGKKMIEVDESGSMWRLEWEMVLPWQVVELEQKHGPSVWFKIDWDDPDLRWVPVNHESRDERGVLNQYDVLKKWFETKEQPVRNIKLMKQPKTDWTVVSDGG